LSEAMKFFGVKLIPGACIIKLTTAVINGFCNKLESLA
jgi:hypothetical protein